MNYKISQNMGAAGSGAGVALVRFTFQIPTFILLCRLPLLPPININSLLPHPLIPQTPSSSSSFSSSLSPNRRASIYSLMYIKTEDRIKMEANLPVGAKKIWSIVRVLFFMSRKGISKKSKFILDLNTMIKRGKIAGKALHNLMFHHQPNRHLSFDARPGEYEFSCSNSPAYPISLFPFHLNKNRNKHNGGTNNGSHFFSCTHAPATDDEDVVTVNAVMKALEMLHSGAASPALPGFGRSPMVRQLRITDSPFPLCDVDVEDSHVDEAAEEYIMKFYNELKKQDIVTLS